MTSWLAAISKNDLSTWRRKIIGRILPSMLVLNLALGDLSVAMAQRRRAEPEANPQFQSDIQGSQQGPGGGKPVAPSEATKDEEKTMDLPANQPKTLGVQIGAVPSLPEEPKLPKNPMETRVTVRVKEAPLATFLDTISAQAKVNFLIMEGLEKKRVTAFLQNVTVREALQILLEVKGLTYQQVGKSNTYIIAPRSRQAPNRITRIYTLSFIPLIPLAQVTSPGTQSSGVTIVNQSQQGQGGGQPGSSGGMPGQQGAVAGSAAADSAIPFLAVVKSVLSKEGTLATDPRTNSLIVTDIAEIFPQVEQLIAELDKKAPQIMIEAQIVEIDSDKTQDLGIEWGGPNGELARFQGGSRETTFPLALPNGLKNTHFFDPNVALGGGSGSSAGGSGSGATGTAVPPGPVAGSLSLVPSIVDFTSLNVIIHALITRSEARFLGKPKVLTLNNRTATIQILRNQAIGANVSASGVGGNTGLVTASVERQQTGLFLKVTPQINKEGYITMQVDPTFTDAVASPIANNGQPVFDPVSRVASSLMRVRNGQTMVLGGLLSSQETKVVKKIPFLGYIPLLGWLFTSSSTARHNTDLVIFLTPTIVNE